jgi:hypothetical protein
MLSIIAANSLACSVKGACLPRGWHHQSTQALGSDPAPLLEPMRSAGRKSDPPARELGVARKDPLKSRWQ